MLMCINLLSVKMFELLPNIEMYYYFVSDQISTNTGIKKIHLRSLLIWKQMKQSKPVGRLSERKIFYFCCSAALFQHAERSGCYHRQTITVNSFYLIKTLNKKKKLTNKCNKHKRAQCGL